MDNVVPMPANRINERRAERSGTFLAAMLRHDGDQRTVMIRNLSTEGAMIEADQLPPLQSLVELVRADLSVSGRVSWIEGNRAGLKFSDPIILSRWAPGLRHRGQMEVDRMMAEVRGTTPPTPEQPVPRTDSCPSSLEARIGEELGMLSRRVGRALQSLSGFAPLMVRHPREMQELEIVEQMLAKFDTVLAAEDRIAAAEAIGIDDVRRRLLR